MITLLQKIKFEYRITIGYLLIGGLWIIFSDALLNYFIKDAYLLTRLQTYKGWFYVIITAILFYSLLKKHLIKLREAERKAVESDRLKTAFLQNISHEIRTPMNGIIGFADLLRYKGLSESQRKEYLDVITKSSSQLLHILNEVLDISLIETGDLSLNESEININRLLDDIYAFHKPLINSSIILLCEKGLPDSTGTVIADGMKVKQVIDNLLNNAIKFTDSGLIKFGYTMSDSCLEFYVKDTGPGIDENIQKLIFERFNKGEIKVARFYDGVGLGLSICSENLKLMNGRIWVDSTPGKGSVFHFTIQYKPAKPLS